MSLQKPRRLLDNSYWFGLSGWHVSVSLCSSAGSLNFSHHLRFAQPPSRGLGLRIKVCLVNPRAPRLATARSSADEFPSKPSGRSGHFRNCICVAAGLVERSVRPRKQLCTKDVFGKPSSWRIPLQRRSGGTLQWQRRTDPYVHHGIQKPRRSRQGP